MAEGDDSGTAGLGEPWTLAPPTPPSLPGTPFVVIGASAGGVDALRVLVATLPVGLPAPIIVAQHLDPTRPSYLGEILTAATALPVHVLLDHPSLPLAPGTIYVVPANRHVRITDHELAVEEGGDGHPKPSIDILLADVAAVFGEGTIAVILTGRGTDGAQGARAVKAAGGTVVIQDPATASFPAMPLAVDPTVVDIVAEVGRIGPALAALLGGEALPAEDRVLRAFLDELRERSGIDFGLYKLPTIRRRLQRRLVAVGAESLTAYQRYLQSHPDEYERLVNSFLIKVTSFFRDPELYAYLRDHVVPDLIEMARVRGDNLRVWSAGCATGQESYSLAILFAETLGEELDQITVRIFATDLDAEAVAVARRGIYPPGDLAALPPAMVARHFMQVEGGYAVSKRIRALTVFGEHDLSQRAPFPRIDLCVCRNVLIYFTPELQAHALRLFAFALRNGGFLVLGKAETARPLDAFFTPVAPSLRVYRRQGERPTLAGMTVPPGGAHAASRPRVPATTRPPRVAAAAPLLEGHARGLLALPVGVVVVDRRYDIQIINNAARRLLGIRREAVGEDLIHLVRGLDATALRAIIDAAFHPDAPRTEDMPLPGTPRADQIMAAREAGGEELFLQVACYPHTTEATSHQAGRRGNDTALLVVIDVTRAEQDRRAQAELAARARAELAEQAARAQAELAEQTVRMAQLAAAERELLAANMEMGAANAELRGRHEDAQLSSEEAQAAIEEVETLNEELQASNEELETLNEELQANNEELHATNAELHVRTTEMLEQAVVVEQQRLAAETERARLEMVLATMADAVLVVTPEGTEVLTNAAYARMFGPAGLDAAADSAGEPLPADAVPSRRAARGETFSMAFTLTTATSGRRWFEAVGGPVQQMGALHWGVVVIRDITGRTMHRLQEEFLATATHELQTTLTAVRAGLGLLDTALGPALQPPERELVAVTRRNVERLHYAINELLAALAPDTASQQIQGGLSIAQAPLDLRIPVAAAAAVVQPQVQEKGQVLTFDLPINLPVVGDARLLERIAVNLLSNACRHTPAGTQISVVGYIAADEVRLEVRDTGPGIPPAEQDTIFERWSHAMEGEEGAGLGLAIARDAALLNGGRLWVESTMGQGATFHVALPLAETAEDAPP